MSRIVLVVKKAFKLQASSFKPQKEFDSTELSVNSYSNFL